MLMFVVPFKNRACGGFPRSADQPSAASYMKLTIVSSTSFATAISCGVLKIATKVVGLKRPE
jgi:hypothetical protein